MNHKISVIMGIYNCQAYLSEAVESIIRQTYTDWELIMCDDGSTDDTFQIARYYRDQYPDKIILIHNEQNMHLSFSLNRCLDLATGYYVARMDADDISDSKRFEKQIDYLRSHPEIDMVGTEMMHFDESGNGNIEYVPDNPDRYILKKDQPFIHATIMSYKYVFDRLNGYTVSDRTIRAQDLDLWFRFYAAGFKGANIHEPLYKMRENKAAFKRRTFKVRLNTYRTTKIGYKMLEYPSMWIIRPTIELFVKSAIPYPFWVLYRRMQKKFDKKR